MKKCVLVAALLGLLFAAPDLLAQEEMVGKVAPDFKVGDMLFDGDVMARSLEECRGEVILIKYWGLRCGPCKAAMPGIQDLWEEYRDRGLHIFHVESQSHTPEEIRAYCEQMGYDFPQTLRSGETDFGAYPGPGSLPYGFLIGVDGKVIWQGRTGYDKIITEEIQKVRYPKLGRAEVAESLEKAAKLFASRKYGSAIKEADKRLQAAKEKGGDQAVIDDAVYIVERANLMGERLQARAEAALKEREVVRALETLKEISVLFKGFPLADEASERFKTLRKDPEIKKELRAEEVLIQIMPRVEKAPTKEKQAALLEAFAAKYDGTKAAERALRKAKTIRG